MSASLSPDLIVTDLARSVQFYTQALGWRRWTGCPVRPAPSSPC